MDPEEYERLGKMKPPASGPPPDPEATRLYDIYAGWTGKLHLWISSELGRYIDCEFVPDKWEFSVYAGAAGVTWSTSGVPRVVRDNAQRCETIRLPRPEDSPDQDTLDAAFRAICLAAARVLRLKVSKDKLETSKAFLRPPVTVKSIRDRKRKRSHEP